MRESTKFIGKRNKGADTRIRFRRNGGRKEEKKEKEKKEKKIAGE